MSGIFQTFVCGSGIVLASQAGSGVTFNFGGCELIWRAEGSRNRERIRLPLRRHSNVLILQQGHVCQHVIMTWSAWLQFAGAFVKRLQEPISLWSWSLRVVLGCLAQLRTALIRQRISGSWPLASRVLARPTRWRALPRSGRWRSRPSEPDGGG